MKHVLLSIVVLLCVLVPAAAGAQDDPVKAKRHYDEGAALYFKGDYAAAVVEFMRAYDAMAEPVFLYNIAMSHWRLGNFGRAIESADKALRAPGLAPDLRAQIAARNHVFRGLQRIESTDWSSEPSAPPPEIEEVAELSPPGPPPRARTLRWVGAGTVVAGVGLLTAFVIAELGLQKTIRDYEAAAAAGDSERFADLRSQIDRRQPVAIALLSAGGGLVAVGAVLWLVDGPGGERGTAVLFGPGQVGARFTW